MAEKPLTEKATPVVKQRRTRANPPNLVRWNYLALMAALGNTPDEIEQQLWLHNMPLPGKGVVAKWRERKRIPAAWMATFVEVAAHRLGLRVIEVLIPSFSDPITRRSLYRPRN
jgi:hypothetical protein